MIAVANTEILGPQNGPAVFMLAEHGIGEHFVSRPAHSALQIYSEATGNARDLEHPLRVANILHDFMGGELAGSVYDAAALHDMAQRATADPDGQTAAIASLQAYAEGVSLETVGDLTKWQYTSALLSDMDEIEECSQQGRQVETESAVVASLLRSEIDVPVPQEAWDAPSGLVDLNEIEKLLQNVNLESALVKAAEMLDNLRNPSSHDRAVLQYVFDAESFYAPLCEAMGFDGLSMALRSEAAIIRLQRGGRDDVLAEADAMLGELSDREQVLSDVAGLFRHLLDGVTTVETPLRDASDHGIKLGNVVLHTLGISGGETKPWAHWRVKSLGSLALKLAKSGEKPADVLGVTIVVGDLDELAVTYKSLVECIRANRVVEERPTARAASGHLQAYSVQGVPDYIAAVTQELYESGIVENADVEEVPKNNGYQVAKATFVYRPHIMDQSRARVDIPIELQMQTAEDWLASRIGSAAHLLYKAGTIGDDHSVIAAIQKRREHLKSPTLNANSYARGEQFSSLVDLAA